MYINKESQNLTFIKEFQNFTHLSVNVKHVLEYFTLPFKEKAKFQNKEVTATLTPKGLKWIKIFINIRCSDELQIN